MQIESFTPKNSSIVNLKAGLSSGQVVQTHFGGNCNRSITDYITAFLIGADKGAYFGCGAWNAAGVSDAPFQWHPAYDKPLGAPKTPAKYDQRTKVWPRQFASGTNVTFDAGANKGSTQWGTGGTD